MGRTGASAYSKFGWESTFKDGATTKDKQFGHNTKYNFTINQNVQAIRGLGARTVSSHAFKQFMGGLSSDFILASPWWLKGLYGAVSTAGASSPYTHTFTLGTAPITMGVELGGAFEDEDVVHTAKGVVIESATIASAINEMATVRLDMMFADYAKTNSVTSGVDESFDAFTFAQGSLELPDATLIAEVQSVEFTMKQNMQMIYGLGNYVPTSVAMKELEVVGRLTATVKNDTLLGYVTGRTEQASLSFKFTNSGAGSAERSIDFQVTNVALSEYASAFEPNEIVLQNIPFSGRTTQAVAVNGTSACP